METEIEAKWLNIDIEEFRSKLKSVGAKLVHAERKMVRKNYDYPDGSLFAKNGWVRLRDEGDKVTLSYKQLNDRTLHGTSEVNVIVDSFDSTDNFLQAIGLESKSLQETRRESWTLEGVEIELDTWPWIPSFVEIEAHSEEKLVRVARRLGLDMADALHGSVETAYQAVYDVTEEDIDGWQEIKFIPVPDWLVSKKKPISSD